MPYQVGIHIVQSNNLNVIKQKQKYKKLEKENKELQHIIASKDNFEPIYFRDINDYKHICMAYEIISYGEEDGVRLEKMDKSYIDKDENELRELLEENHPGLKPQNSTRNTNFTMNRPGIPINGSNTLYNNPSCSKYKNSETKYTYKHKWADNNELNNKFKKNNKIGTVVFLFQPYD